MKKKLLFPLLLLFACAGCQYDDAELWDKVDEHEGRLTELEKKVKDMNDGIAGLQTIVTALNENDWITGVTPLADGSGYTIQFSKQSPITIKHGANGANGADGKDGKDGADAPVVGIKSETGVYYWTLNGEWLLDTAGERMPVTGKDGKDGLNGQDGLNGLDGKDGISPQVRINPTTLLWEISTDGGTTWNATTVVAQGDSFFSDVTVEDEKVIFTLSDNTVLEVARYNAPKLTFAGLNSDGSFSFPADGAFHDITLTASTNVTRVGVASPNPAPSGWSWKADTNKISISSANVVTELDILVVATTAEGTSASYWITLAPVLVPTPTGSTALQDAIDALEAAGGGILRLEAGTYETTANLTITESVTIKGAGTGQTILKTGITASAPVTLGDLTVTSSSTPVINITANAPLVASGVKIVQESAGTSSANTAAITSAGDIKLTDSEIYLGATAYNRGINASGAQMTLTNTTIRTASVNDSSNATYSRGINLTSPNQTVAISGCTFEGLYYPVNLYGSDNSVITIENTTLDGYSAINSWSPGVTFNITNSTLIGRNPYSGTSNNFAVIVLNKDATDNAQNTTVNITDSRLSNVMTGDCLEYMFSIRSDNNKINLLGNTSLTDTSNKLPYLASTTGADNAYNAASTVTLTGMTGVTLSEQL